MTKNEYIQRYGEDAYRKYLEKCKRYYQEHKEERNEYQKQYNQDNKDELAEYQKQYYQEHKDEYLEKCKQYYQNNKDELAERKKQYRQSHKDEIAERNKQYRQSHKDEIAERNKQYYSTPIGRAITLVGSYRFSDKLRNRGECTLTPQWIVDNIFTSKCIYCGESDWKKLGVDRINNDLPHTEDNVNPCCGRCNLERHTKDFETFLKFKYNRNRKQNDTN